MPCRLLQRLGRCRISWTLQLLTTPGTTNNAQPAQEVGLRQLNAPKITPWCFHSSNTCTLMQMHLFQLIHTTSIICPLDQPAMQVLQLASHLPLWDRVHRQLHPATTTCITCTLDTIKG